MDKDISKSISQAGTGFMVTLTDVIHQLEDKGYVENLSLHFDHFECRDGAIRLYADDFNVDEVIRFENSSDPDDQSILYAISSTEQSLKGILVESYGFYHNDLSPEILQKLKDHSNATVVA